VVVGKFQSDVELENMIEKWLWQSHVQRRVIILSLINYRYEKYLTTCLHLLPHAL
jgi:hypothetical protein